MDRAAETALILGTFNVKNVETNLIYIQKLLKNCDILFIQETWLFNFQLPLLGEYFSTHVSVGKAVDDDNPLPPTQKPRGYGGVACLIRKDLDIRHKFHLSGSCRVLTLEILCEPPVCAIGVYMPVRGTSKKQEYQEVLDEIAEIIQTFKTTHIMILLGDMNASMMDRCGNERDKLLEQFINENFLFHRQFGKNTYIHSDNLCSSEIDYIFCSNNGGNMMFEVNVLSDCLNTSDHLPVVAKLEVVKPLCVDQQKTIDIRPKWDKCNHQIYKGSINRLLGSFPEDIKSEFEFMCALGHMTSVLKKATAASIPGYRSKIRVKPSKSRMWNDRIEKAVKRSKEVWWEWKISGSPNDRDHPLNIQRREARKSIRSEQRRAAAQRRIEKVENIMSAGSDSKTFAKLINQQRKANNTNVKAIVVNGTVCDTPETVCSGWATHFEKLATPLECEQFDHQHLESVHRDIITIENTLTKSTLPTIDISKQELHNAISKLNNNKAADVLSLTSEHFKLGKGSIDRYLLNLLNYMIEEKHVAPVLKEGLLTTIFKKGDKSDPSNYRGITVTPVIFKILEHILNERQNIILLETQSKLQKVARRVVHQWEQLLSSQNASMNQRIKKIRCSWPHWTSRRRSMWSTTNSC